jgi:hypothetical protein
MKSFIVAHSMAELLTRDREKAFVDCARKIEEKRINERLERLRPVIRDAEKTGDKGRAADLLEEYQSILEQKSRIGLHWHDTCRSFD